MRAKANSMKLRLLSTAVLLPVAVASVYFGAWWFAAFLAVVCAAMCWEWARLCNPDRTEVQVIMAAAGELPRISPRRFNPEGTAWLPVMHLEEEGWHFTALYSNTALAHQLGRIHDWVVIFFYDNHQREGQQTVVTETRGPLTGMRVVRGRESECRAYYESETTSHHRA